MIKLALGDDDGARDELTHGAGRSTRTSARSTRRIARQTLAELDGADATAGVGG